MVQTALFKKYPSRHTLSQIAVGYDGTKLRQVKMIPLIPRNPV